MDQKNETKRRFGDQGILSVASRRRGGPEKTLLACFGVARDVKGECPARARRDRLGRCDATGPRQLARLARSANGRSRDGLWSTHTAARARRRAAAPIEGPRRHAPCLAPAASLTSTAPQSRAAADDANDWRAGSLPARNLIRCY